jgi:stromal membrane-associated protein
MKAQEAILNKCLAEKGNEVCADCGARSPRWASVTLGIFLCIRCAGIHRQIGVHVTLVKSVNLDQWKPEHLQKIQQVGNQRAAAIYEFNVPPAARPNPSDQYAVEQWIRNKYERKLYLDKSAVAGPSPTGSPLRQSPSPSPSRAPHSPPSSPIDRVSAAHRRTRSRDERPAAQRTHPTHIRSTSVSTSSAQAEAGPFFDFTAATPPPPVTAPAAHVLPGSMSTPNFPAFNLFSSMSTPSPQVAAPMTAPALAPAPAPPAAQPLPTSLFEGFTLGSTTSGPASPSPLAAAPVPAPSYDATKANIMGLFSSPGAPTAASPASLGSPGMPMGGLMMGQPSPMMGGMGMGMPMTGMPASYGTPMSPVGYPTATGYPTAMYTTTPTGYQHYFPTASG